MNSPVFNESIPSRDFLSQFQGRFYGIRKWEQLDEFWVLLKKQQNKHWFIYQIGGQPPTATASPEELIRFIDHIDQLLRSEHQENYCGIVYADHLENPGFIKIYDPNNLGVVCGFSENPPLPGWVLSKTQPVDLPEAFPPPQNRRRWWRRLFHKN